MPEFRQLPTDNLEELAKKSDPDTTPVPSIPCCCYLPVLTRFGRWHRMGPSHLWIYHGFCKIEPSRKKIYLHYRQPRGWTPGYRNKIRRWMLIWFLPRVPPRGWLGSS